LLICTFLFFLCFKFLLLFFYHFYYQHAFFLCFNFLYIMHMHLYIGYELMPHVSHALIFFEMTHKLLG